MPPQTRSAFTGSDGLDPEAGLIADSAGNLYGTTLGGATAGCDVPACGVVFKISTDGTETVLYAFKGGSDGDVPVASLIADSSGSLYGTTEAGGASGSGTVFKLTGTGFVVFAGTPGRPNCRGKSVSALVRQYGSLNAAAAALGFSSVQALQEAIRAFCSA